ncbi:hypothetical protein MESS4_520059 [Mesorhizobium sp. STM 4661]|nr:hypothetical protein MESS4_520059 [Mesorhizobium sp. STM 4661]
MCFLQRSTKSNTSESIMPETPRLHAEGQVYIKLEHSNIPSLPLPIPLIAFAMRVLRGCWKRTLAARRCTGGIVDAARPFHSLTWKEHGEAQPGG